MPLCQLCTHRSAARLVLSELNGEEPPRAERACLECAAPLGGEPTTYIVRPLKRIDTNASANSRARWVRTLLTENGYDTRLHHVTALDNIARSTIVTPRSGADVEPVLALFRALGWSPFVSPLGWISSGMPAAPKKEPARVAS